MSPTTTQAGERATAMVSNLALVAALSRPATYAGQPTVRVHETHVSWVFVAGERVYKIKKPIALGFLDYRTLARRRAACHEEVAVNCELAPGVYLGVRAIVATEEGFRLAPDDSPRALEYAVEMRRFDEADTLTGLIAADELRHAQIRSVARRLAAFHRTAPVVSGGQPTRVLDMWQTNVLQLRAVSDPDLDHHAALDVAATFGAAFVGSHAAEIERRVRQGLVRDGHGDLRCEHVLARPTVKIVDRIEFDPGLRHLDVAADVAFLTMDLEARDQRWAALELVKFYRAAGGRPGSAHLRSFYSAHWALVRAKVALIAARQHESQATARRQEALKLLALAERLCWRARGPLAVVVCGPAASGKSVLASELSRRSAMPVVSSDVVRKRRAGLDPVQRARAEHYSDAFTQATYEQLAAEAQQHARDGQGVIVDATCRTAAQRALVLGRLEQAGVSCLTVSCELPLNVAVGRATRRLHDPDRVSDATPEIVKAQFRSFEALDELPPAGVLRLNTRQDLGDQVARVTRAIDHSLSQHHRPGDRAEDGAAGAPPRTDVAVRPGAAA